MVQAQDNSETEGVGCKKSLSSPTISVLTFIYSAFPESIQFVSVESPNSKPGENTWKKTYLFLRSDLIYSVENKLNAQ